MKKPGVKSHKGQGGLVPVADILSKSRALKNVSLTPHMMKLLDAGQAIRTEPDAAEAAYMAPAPQRPKAAHYRYRLLSPADGADPRGRRQCGKIGNGQPLGRVHR